MNRVNQQQIQTNWWSTVRGLTWVVQFTNWTNLKRKEWSRNQRLRNITRWSRWWEGNLLFRVGSIRSIRASIRSSERQPLKSTRNYPKTKTKKEWIQVRSQISNWYFSRISRRLFSLSQPNTLYRQMNWQDSELQSKLDQKLLVFSTCRQTLSATYPTKLTTSGTGEKTSGWMPSKRISLCHQPLHQDKVSKAVKASTYKAKKPRSSTYLKEPESLSLKTNKKYLVSGCH